MATTLRNYQKEYAERIRRGLERGLSRSSSRGHPRAGERPRSKGNTPSSFNPYSREEMALKMLRRGSTLQAAAKQHRMSQERLRAYMREHTQVRREKGRWLISDTRVKRFPFYSQGELIAPEMASEEATLAGRFMQAVKAYLPSQNDTLLAPYIGKGVHDVNGKFHPFETDGNTLYELDHRGELAIPEQYRISERKAS